MAVTTATDPTDKTEIQQKIARAQALGDKGQTEDARAIYESLLPGLRVNGPSVELGQVLNALSQAADDNGNYQMAVKLGAESADAYRQAGDLKGEGHAFLNRGIAQMDLASYAAAHQSFEQALTLSRRAGDSENVVHTLNNQGNAYYFEGNYFEASRAYLEAMSFLEEAPGFPKLAYWRQITEFNQATLYQRLGRYQKALEIYRRVAASSQLTHSNRAHLLGNLGALYRRLGDAHKALDSYRAAQQLYLKEHDVDGEIGVLKNIGIVYALQLDDLAQARMIFNLALSRAVKTHNRREEMQAHLYLGETYFREHSTQSARTEFERARALAHELGTTEEEWKALYGLGRVEEQSSSVEAAESDYRQAIAIIETSRASLQLSALRAEFLADKRDAYDALIAILVDKNDVSEAFSFLERSRARTFQDRLSTSHAGSARTGPLTLDEVRSELVSGATLLEFWTAGDRIALIWCTRDQCGMASKTLSPDQQSGIRAFLGEIPNGLDGAWRDRLTLLDAIFPESSPPIPSGTTHLLIVPDGWLSFVPFDLVHVQAPSTTLLIEKYDISYLPSAALLRRLTADRTLHFPWTHELVAFGDPIISPEPGLLPDESQDPVRQAQLLPFSAEEIRSIAKMASGRSELFLGKNNLKRSFLSGRANSALLLHVSTHAFSDADNPEESRMLFSPDKAEDGADYVFLRELYDLDLSNVRLATISACDTERGNIVRGEGVQAFSRALLSAGSRSSLTVLWRVEDQATAEFMRQFYFFALQQHKPTAEALRLAKLKFLSSNTRLQNPRYWAGFVLNGDGFAELPRILSWTWLVILGCGVLAVAALATAVLTLRVGRRFDR